MSLLCEFSDSSSYLVKDELNEKKFKFILAESLTQAANRRLLIGYKVHVTKNVKPEPNQMRGNDVYQKISVMCPDNIQGSHVC